MPTSVLTLEYQVVNIPSRPRSIKTASKVIPDDLTDTLRARLQSLRPSVKADYLKTECFSKFVSVDTDPPAVRRGRAIAKWLATERDNEATNDRLLTTHEEYNILPRVTYRRFVDFCRALIIEILGGETVPLETLIGSFSGGASTSRNRTKSHPSSKYLGKADVTPRCLEIFELIRPEIPGWLGSTELDLNLVRGNELFTVPKKTDIDRCACKEPDINMFVQKGIGRHIRESLRRIGITLNDQGKNRSLARIGSISGDLATLDLSSASDSVSVELVAEMLPVFWYNLLDSVRSPVTMIDGDEHRNEMFSSMGNGFTFELESLLFYVLTRATCYFKGIPGIVSIYGDDIICPSEAFSDLEWVLSYFGFQLNAKKSFFRGPFRESCGGHYHDGIDITPFYVKAPVQTVSDVIHVANALRRWAEIPGLSILDPEVEDIWLWLKTYVPEHLWGGDNLSSIYQLASHDVSSHVLREETKRASTGMGGYFHWLNATWDRIKSSDGVETSSLTRSLGRMRVRPVRIPTVPRLPAHFSHEVFNPY